MLSQCPGDRFAAKRAIIYLRNIVDIENFTILRKIERCERVVKKEMIPNLAEILNRLEKEIEIEIILSVVESNLKDLKYLKNGRIKIMKTL